MKKVRIIAGTALVMAICSFTLLVNRPSDQISTKTNKKDCEKVRKKLSRLRVKVSLGGGDRNYWVKISSLIKQSKKSGCDCREYIRSLQKAKDRALGIARQSNSSENIEQGSLDNLVQALEKAESKIEDCK